MAGTATQVTHGAAGEYFPSLSADGAKLSFLSRRANGERLFYRELDTGREKEVSTEGYRYTTPVFTHDGTKILCVENASPKSSQNFIFEVPVSSGLSRKVWDKEPFSWLWDLAPDDSTLLLQAPYRSGVKELDLKSGAITMFLDDPEVLNEAHFSHDGRWVVFTSAPRTEFNSDPALSRVFIAPFRKALVPRSEWIPVTGNNLDFYPHFSENDKSIYFESHRDGFRCIWAQRLMPGKQPDGKPHAIYHSHERSRPVSWKLGVGPRAIVFDRMELGGNIWLMEPVKSDAH